MENKKINVLKAYIKSVINQIAINVVVVVNNLPP
jgi:hypothetical protein